MKAKYILFPLLLGSLTTAKATPNTTTHFIENKGQVTDQYLQPRSDIDFRTGSPGLSLFIGNGQLHYQWSSQLAGQPLKTALYRMDVALIGANTKAAVISEQPQDYYERYYTQSQHGTIAHSYQKVTYKDVYPNIDWVLHISGSKVEYDFIVHPGGKVSDIRLQYSGTSKLTIGSGQLTATTPMGTITEAAPISHDATGKAIATAFRLQGNIVTFDVATYSGTLTIDPTLSWSTYYGGSGTETLRSGCVAGDNAGNSYLGGNTSSTSSIATTGSYQDTLTTGSTDAFFVKFNSGGTRMWATYYGGSGSENVYGITCDPSGKVYLSGYTSSSTDMTTGGAHQSVLGSDGQDAFLAKFDGSGSRDWSTYYGGDATEQGLAVTCDLAGNVYLGGYTLSISGIATTGAFQTTPGGGQDAFLVKFNSTGARQWGTYFGGALTDQGLSIACDPSNNVCLSGYTQSTSGIATTGAYQTGFGGNRDAYIVQFNSMGAQQWATYLGGAGIETGYSLACDGTGNIYMAGAASSTSGVATTGSFQSTFGGGAGDAMLAKFSGTGVMRWATYYGGSANDVGYGICSRDGVLFLSGVSSSTASIATPGTFQDTLTAGSDAMLIKFDTAGSQIWGTYFGGEGSDFGYGVYCQSTYKIALGGATASYGLLSTTGAVQPSNGGGTYDGFLAVFDDCTMTVPASITGPDTVCRGTAYTYTTPTVAGATSYTWTLPSGWSGTSATNSISVIAGASTDTVRVAANFACGTSAVIKKAVAVSPRPVLSPAGPVSLCSGNSALLTSTAATAYSWLQGGVLIAGASGPSYALTASGSYAVIAISTSGCSDTSAALTATVHPLPVPVVTLGSGVLSTTVYASYQWSHNGTDITGATGQSYTLVSTSGTYAVTVTDANGCSGTSLPYSPLVGVAPLAAGTVVRIYPNPAVDKIYVEADGKVTISITRMDGRLLGGYSGPTAIDVSGLASGVYIIKVTDEHNLPVTTKQLVISQR